jgi:hypothetical protein
MVISRRLYIMLSKLLSAIHSLSLLRRLRGFLDCIPFIALESASAEPLFICAKIWQLRTLGDPVPLAVSLTPEKLSCQLASLTLPAKLEDPNRILNFAESAGTSTRP